MRRFLSVALLITLFFSASGRLQANDDGSKTDFDQGTSASDLLNKVRARAADQSQLSPLPKVSADYHALILKPVNPDGTYPGGLVQAIQNSEAYRTASGLKQDPRYGDLDSDVRQPLDADWAQINQSRSDLLSRASDWENRNEQLETDRQGLERERAALEQRRQAINSEVEQFNQQCTNRPLPPDEYQRCLAWRDRIEQKKQQYLSDVAEFNKKVDAWNSRSSAIFNERRTLVGQIQTWEDNARKWADAAKKALEDVCSHLSAVTLDPPNPPPLDAGGKQYPFKAIVSFGGVGFAPNSCAVEISWKIDGKIGTPSFPDPNDAKLMILTTGNDAADGSVSVKVTERKTNKEIIATALVKVKSRNCDFERLEKQYHENCPGGQPPVDCSKEGNCPKLLDGAARNMACVNAATEFNQQCFGGSNGDLSAAVTAANRAALTCQTIYAKLCNQGQPGPGWCKVLKIDRDESGRATRCHFACNVNGTISFPEGLPAPKGKPCIADEGDFFPIPQRSTGGPMCIPGQKDW